MIWTLSDSHLEKVLSACRHMTITETTCQDVGQNLERLGQKDNSTP